MPSAGEQMIHIVSLTTIFACIAWWWVALAWSAGDRRMDDLAEQPLPSLHDLPSLSIIVPARNEASVVGNSLAAIFGDAPPGTDVILIDDRSKDETGKIALAMARSDSRLKVITVEQLPDGWLGKNHALQTGADESKGEWILFTDADVHFEPGCLARALDYARKNDVDHLIAAPRMATKGFWEKVFVSFFIVSLLTWLRAWRVNSEEGKGFIGIGAFNMVRRQAYERAGQHAALKDEVIDDLVLGRNLRMTGSRQRIVGGKGCLWVRWHEGLWGLVKGVEKNAYSGFGYNPLRMIAGCLALMAGTVVPAVALFTGDARAVIPGTGVFIAFAICYRLAGRNSDIRWTYFVTFPVGASLQVLAIVRSAFLYHVRGGVRWRGTVYKKVGKGL